jgi:Na+/melibiose symporter-like transporter
VADTRKASFAGLTLSRLFARPLVPVMGTYLTYVVDRRAGSALAVTFGLTAHRYVSAAVYPIAGRLSDRTGAGLGRRVPYMVVGLLTTAVAVWLFTVVDGYWPLVLAIVLAREGMAINTVARAGVTPDVFGRSRWVLAVLAVGAATLVPAGIILAIIRYTWDQNDPASWNLTFRVASVGLVLAAISVALFVREAPASRVAAAVAAKRSWREELRTFLARPNAPELLLTVLFLIAAIAATGRLLPVWADRRLGAGGADMAGVSVAIAVGSAVLAPFGLILASRVHPRRFAVFATVFGAGVVFAHVFVTEIWMFVLASIITVPLTVAAIVSLVPMIIKLVPSADNVGESVGFLLGGLAVVNMAASYSSAALVDITGDYRLIWVVAAAFTLAAAIPLSRVVVPPGNERTNVQTLLRDGLDAAGLGKGDEGGVVKRLFGGEVTPVDVAGEAADER